MTENRNDFPVDKRTYMALKNSSLTLLCQIVFLLVSFVCRTIFTYLLGAEYLGVNGLFANVITILSFAELGIGSALVYRLYEPISKGDDRRIAILLNLYKRIYIAIIMIILAAGLLITPFIHLIVDTPNVSEDIRLLFLLYLAKTVVTYVFVYKKTLLIANQKSYVVNIYTQFFNIIQNICQIMFLLLWRNFVVYLFIDIIFNLVNNVACSFRADREFNTLKDYEDFSTNDDDIKGLIKDAKGLLLTKIATTAYAGTDNVFISVFIGIRYVGILTNYTLLLGIINGIMNKIFDSITASIGNLISTGKKHELPGIIRRMFFANAFLYSFVGLEMFFLLRQFVTKVWLTEEYLLPVSVVSIVIIEMILRSLHYPVYIARNAIGAFSEYRKVMVALAFLNIVLDYLWIRPFGIIGLYMSTILCRGITFFLDVVVLYKVKLGLPVLLYYRYVLKWAVFITISGVVIYWIKSVVVIDGIMGMVTNALMILIIYLAFFVLLFIKDDEYRYYHGLLKRVRQR